MVDYPSDSYLYFIARVLYLFSTFLGAFILYTKLRKINISKLKTLCLLLVVIVLLGVCQLLGGVANTYIKVLFIIALCVLFIILDIKNVCFAIPTAIVSIAISICLQYLAIFVSSIIIYIIRATNQKIIATLVICTLQVLVCVLLAKNKKLKNCFIFFENEQNAGLGMLISSYIFTFSLFITKQISVDIIWGTVLFAVLPLAFTGLILWIRSIVKRYYKNKLQDRANEYTKQEIEDKDKRIERLESEVSTLAKQLHRDNHLLSSLDRSVQTLADCDSDEQRAQIIEEIHTMCRERNELIAKEQQQNKILPSTGIALIDGSLSEMYVKAAARGISFDLTVSEEPYYLVNNIISQTDLQTLLCDHIKDAIIAVESAGITDGRILVTIEKNDGIFEIAVRDNGVDFAPDTLARLGREQITTHADDGGSGIGFMTTFETLRKTKGSLIITEYEQKTPFTKSVAFVFDGLNRFIISSYRKEVLKNTIRRDDVMIIAQ